MDYWDTSALFKLYADEVDSQWFSDYAVNRQEPIRTSSISAVEIASAAYRQWRAKNLKPSGTLEIATEFQRDRETRRLILIACSDVVVAKAQQIVNLAATHSPAIMIRSLDAIHVASALAIGAKFIVATDARVRAVAKLSGLKLIPS